MLEDLSQLRRLLKTDINLGNSERLKSNNENLEQSQSCGYSGRHTEVKETLETLKTKVTLED